MAVYNWHIKPDTEGGATAWLAMQKESMKKYPGTKSEMMFTWASSDNTEAYGIEVCTDACWVEQQAFFKSDAMKEDLPKMMGCLSGFDGHMFGTLSKETTAIAKGWSELQDYNFELVSAPHHTDLAGTTEPEFAYLGKIKTKEGKADEFLASWCELMKENPAADFAYVVHKVDDSNLFMVRTGLSKDALAEQEGMQKFGEDPGNMRIVTPMLALVESMNNTAFNTSEDLKKAWDGWAQMDNITNEWPTYGIGVLKGTELPEAKPPRGGCINPRTC